ncbi:MAG TPA: peptidoglycan-binding protein [Candidatus Competibacteraceae bacterium]|nr:peptidoglycan-binding protein [Candidatus Competibacteraceae bacterium]
MRYELDLEAEPFEAYAEFDEQPEAWDGELTDFEEEEEIQRSRRPVRPAGFRPRPGRPPRLPPRPVRPPKPRPEKFRSPQVVVGPAVIVHEPPISPTSPTPPAGAPAAGAPPEGGPPAPEGSEYIRWVQESLNRILGLRLPVDGITGPETRSAIRSFQQREGLPVDGIVGPDTQEALLRARRGQTLLPAGSADQTAGAPASDKEWDDEESLESYWLPIGQPASNTQPVLRRGSTGSAVKELQNRLAALGFNPGPADGIFGSMTEVAVKAFQRSRGLAADGIVGSQTWGQLYAQPGTGGAQPSPGPAAGEPQVTIGSNVRVSSNAVRILKDILRMAGLTRATITSGRRTANDQARVMYDLIERNGVSYAKNLYGASGDKVIDVYSAQKAAGKSATAIKQAMEAKINELGCHNVSHHCSDTHDVIDVAPSSIADQAAFRLALDTALRNGIIDKYITPPQDPAFHIEIILSPTANELMARILRSPPLPLDAFLPRGAQFEMD